MKRILMIALLATSLVGFAGLASADGNSRSGYAPRVDTREARQHQRIAQGWRSGQLTPGEGRQLQNGQRRVHRFENRAGFDGRITFRERARLHRMQNVQSRRIWRFKHNGRCS
jgi:hypothetical protein